MNLITGIIIYLGIWSCHYSGGDHNEVHAPMGVELKINDRFAVSRLTYQNSFNVNSDSLSLVTSWKYFTLYTGLVTGYDSENLMPLIIPAARYQYKNLIINAGCLPAFKSAACALILKWEI